MTFRTLATAATLASLVAPFVSRGTLAQQIHNTPRLLLQNSMVPAIQQPQISQQCKPDADQQMMAFPVPLSPPLYSQVPAMNLENGGVFPPAAPPPPTMGFICYAEQVTGSLAQLAPVGSQCYVLAYGVTYPGIVGQ